MDEFSDAFRGAYRSLWFVAVGTSSCASEADDIVQEAAVVALKKLHEFQPGTDFVAWMAQIVRYVGLNHSRKRRRRPMNNADPSTQTDAAHRAHAGETPAPGNSALKHGILTALEDVSDTARACLILRTVEDMPYGRIAELLEIPEGTAMSHVHRTRQILRKRLRQIAQPQHNWTEGNG
ncbi:MAG: RNA polymerase sigma factor [Phycisphaerae bacterium]|nr:RNA polymerase sigma factor [Phycisphaerae bacterium]